MPDDLFEKLAHSGWAGIDLCLTDSDCESLLDWANNLMDNGHFSPAQMGRSSERHKDKLVRGDSTYWIDHSDHPTLFAALENLRTQLNRNLFLGIQDFECHLAHYPPGAGYAKHLDQSPSFQPLLGERVITFIVYLNKNWAPEDGGELKIFIDQDHPLSVEPLWGRMILFFSDRLWHEVAQSKKDRWSLTGWFRRRRL